GPDGDVILSIYPQVSTITGYLNINGASLPQISTREQQTTVRVRDGETIVIGGLIRDDELKSIQRVPILSRIPLFGELFTYRSKTRTRTELIITITPEVQKEGVHAPPVPSAAPDAKPGAGKVAPPNPQQGKPQ